MSVSVVGVLVSFLGSDHFNVNSLGKVTFANNTEYDGSPTTYTFTVWATDGGSPQLTGSVAVTLKLTESGRKLFKVYYFPITKNSSYNNISKVSVSRWRRFVMSFLKSNYRRKLECVAVLTCK